MLGTYSGSVTSSVVDSAAGPLVLEAAGTNAACPAAAQAPTACVFRIDVHGTLSDPVGVGSAVNLLGPGPAVVVSDTVDRAVRPGAPVLGLGRCGAPGVHQ